ncbi:MAG: glucose 1-dehydrogenase [Terriglobales bacterium]
MQAIAIRPGAGAPHLVDRPQPGLTAPDQVLLRVLRVGICGTDREETSGGRAEAPAGQSELILGHEMLGRVEQTGAQVTRVKPGDLGVFTVRRGCTQCLPCRMGRADMCLTGKYHERGIWGLDGYQAEFAVDQESYLVRLDPELAGIGVLAEPMSVAEKAIDEARRIQVGRLPQAGASPDWWFGRPCLVAGLGPIGLLAALALRLRGAAVYGLDIVPESTARPQWLLAIGGQYINGKQVPTDQIRTLKGAMDVVIEAAGIASLSFNLLDALAPTGVIVLTGIPGGDRPLQFDGAALVRGLVLGNQAMAGSVNAARDHFQMGVDDMLAAELRWPGHVAKLITHKYAAKDFATAFSQHPADEIKAVIEWAQ